MATPANQGSLTGASDGFVSTVQQGFSKLFEVAGQASTKYLMDQWGLSTQGNGVDQQIFRNQITDQTTSIKGATPAGLVDMNVSGNAMLVLIIAGVALFLVFR